MQAVANNPKFAKKVGVPQAVGKEYTKSEGGMFRVGGSRETKAQREKRDAERKAAKQRPEKKGQRGEDFKSRLGGQSVPRARKNVGMISVEEMPKKAKGGKMKSSCGTKKYAKGGSVRGDGMCKRGKTRGQMR